MGDGAGSGSSERNPFQAPVVAASFDDDHRYRLIPCRAHEHEIPSGRMSDV